MESVIGVFMIVVITIAVALAAATWLFGMWNSEQQEFMVTPILSVSSNTNLQGSGSNPVLQLYMENKGTKSVKILMIKLITSSGSYVNKTVYTVPAGSSLNIIIKDWLIEGTPDPVKPGNVYRIIIYTDNTGELFFDVTAS